MNAATEAGPAWLATTPDDMEGLMRAARLADWYVLTEIEDNGLRVAPWTYDCSAMVDARENSPAFIDVNKACIDHALWRRLVQQVPGRGPLVLRIINKNPEA